MLNVLIVNYNTQEFTDCAIKSLNKSTPGCKIYVFDNSDETPFVNTFGNVTVIDNTQKQLIDFDAFLERYPTRMKSNCSRIRMFGSAKHCYTINYFMDMFDENFILLDSDVIVKRDLNELVDDRYIFVAGVEEQPLARSIKRVLPFVCYINLKKCKEHNVPFFDENYMHGLYLSREGDKYDTGAAFFMYASKYEYKSIDYRKYVEHFKGGSWDDKVNRSVGAYKKPEDFINKFSSFWKSDNKNVVYTCISGNYDTLREPKVVEPGYDYICFTDQPFTSSTWIIKPIPKELSDLSQVKRQRCIKTMPHKFLSEYDFSIWVDSNVDLKGNIEAYKEANGVNKENGYLFVGKHPVRDCLYTEMKACLDYKKASLSEMEPQIEGYRQEGMPEHFGLPQTCIMLRYHNDSRAIAFAEAWFEEIKNKCHRDQLSFTYVQWKLGSEGIVYLPSKIFSCEAFKWSGGHKPVLNRVEEQQKKFVPIKQDSRPVVQPEEEPKKVNNLTIRVREILEQRRRSRINGMTL